MPSSPPRHRLAPTARCWRSPRQLGVTRMGTPRPVALPSPASPGAGPGSTTSSFSVRLGLSGPPEQAKQARTRPPGAAQPTSRGARGPWRRRPENLLFTGRERSQPGFASLFCGSLSADSRVRRGQGSHPQIHPGRERGCGAQGNPKSWKGPPAAGGAKLGVRVSVTRSAEIGARLNTVPRGTKP